MSLVSSQSMQNVNLRMAMNKRITQYSEIAAAHTNPNWKWVQIKDTYKGFEGFARTDKGEFWAQVPTTKEKLIIYLHEVAHLTLDHRSCHAVQRVINEYEAVKLSLQWLAEAGISVGRNLLRKQRDIVAGYWLIATFHASDKEIENAPSQFDEVTEYCMGG